jgi:hypothetical protein
MALLIDSVLVVVPAPLLVVVVIVTLPLRSPLLRVVAPCFQTKVNGTVP